MGKFREKFCSLFILIILAEAGSRALLPVESMLEVKSQPEGDKVHGIFSTICGHSVINGLLLIERVLRPGCIV